MKKLTISDLQPGVSFKFVEASSLRYVVVCVHKAPVRVSFGHLKVLKHPCVVCNAISRETGYLYPTQVDIPFSLLKKNPFCED